MTLSEHFQNLIKKIVETKTKWMSLTGTHIHGRSCSWLRTGTSIKSGGAKITLWAHTSPLSDMMRYLSVFNMCVSNVLHVLKHIIPP